MIEAIIIVILVIFLFLQSWRSTLIPAITIPVSLVGTFAFVKLFGFSINTLTLFGITLATGLVVDDAIVVIENVERHLEEGIKDPRRASEVAMGEVTSAVIATSLVLIAVFVPISLFPGTTGRLYQQFALTIAFSIALSAFNALTLTPALSALLLRHSVGKKNPLFRGINRLITTGTKGYTRRPAQSLEHAKISGLHRLRRRPRGCLLGLQAAFPPASCPMKTRATSWPSCKRQKAPRWNTPPGITRAGCNYPQPEPRHQRRLRRARFQLYRRRAQSRHDLR